MNDCSKAARAADRARIITIDAEIRELQERIRVLHLEREPCQQRLDAYKYPVITLPNEITSEIFVRFLPRYPDCSPLSGLTSPTTLTHICRQWRDIAVATPMHWRALYIGSAASRTGQVQRVVHTWLDRSGSCPLSINVERDYSGATTQKESLIATLQHRERWQHAQLNLAAEKMALIKGPMPLLESLCVAVNLLDYTHPATTVGDFPRLRSVTLDDANHGNWLPLSQLTTLTLNDVHGVNYLAPLQAAVNLAHLYLVDCSAPEFGPSNTLTRLEILVVFSGGPLRRKHVRSVTCLISRSGCKLQQILFTGTSEVSEESLRAALPSVPTVTFDKKYDWYYEAGRGFKNGLGL
ncbi:hypothetical protein FB45DRAFT_1124774 [Roridomyces roridus]|uniref:F-box domain-containing protein n=1 Tax=Roridomyces roridus TaxID=1738132 RepID=A0AAD7FSV5_9AGAR|nr:hypothetical protein FB45DRAFT_1124774 [Roridomyces roridus]